MSATDQQETRLRRLRQIAAEHTEEIYDAETHDQLAGAEPVAPFAAVTSEGSADSSFHRNGHLLMFGTRSQMEKTLAEAAADGWISHGRVWNLDADWDSWGNLDLTYTVRVREAGNHG
jgi:hypothetical protein